MDQAQNRIKRLFTAFGPGKKITFFAIIVLISCAFIIAVSRPEENAEQNVVWVVNSEHSSDAVRDNRIAADLVRRPGFTWIRKSAEEYRKLSSGVAGKALATVIIGDALQPPNMLGRTATIFPIQIRESQATYLKITQAVYTSMFAARVAEFLEVSTAVQAKLSATSFTLGGIDGTLRQSGSTVDQSTQSFNEIVAQSAPMLQDTKTLLDSYKPSVGALSNLADRILSLSAAIRPIGITLGDLRSGGQLANEALDRLRPFRPQIDALSPLVNQLVQDSSSPEMQNLGRQLQLLLNFLSHGDSATSDFEGMAGASDLAILLGTSVDDTTSIDRLMVLSSNRVRNVVNTFGHASLTFDKAQSMMTNSRTTFANTKGDVLRRLEEFRSVIKRLDTSVNEATRMLSTAVNLPRSSATPVIVDQRVLQAMDIAPRVSFLLLIGAMCNAWLLGIRKNGRQEIFKILSVGLVTSAMIGATAALCMYRNGNFAHYFAVSTLIVLTGTVIVSLMVMISGRIGFLFPGLILTVDYVSSIIYRPGDPATRYFRQYCPSDFVTNLIGDQYRVMGQLHNIGILIIAVLAICAVFRRTCVHNNVPVAIA
ncbi:Uncharacterised protein [Mycobacteroides abscessus subsp. massiliense]|uniref:hypothetical protein n=1 Tax=Mycobacteroides abscessus TaxID=36809 RepID=UPI0009A6B5C3|nr:hypothetical protein [Mycobacteroides abscessus]SKU60333.1 Uncharacterised protein [Mycobacteroides abscessus subsp. massiliense]